MFADLLIAFFAFVMGIFLLTSTDQWNDKLNSSNGKTLMTRLFITMGAVAGVLLLIFGLLHLMIFVVEFITT